MSTPLALSLRVDVAARTVEGIVVPYGRVARVRQGGRYRFAPAALWYDDVRRVQLLREHCYSLRLGRMVYHEDRPPVGAFARYLVARGARGDEALDLALAGRLGPSVGVDFRPRRGHGPRPAVPGCDVGAARVLAGDEPHGAARVPLTTTGVCERCLAYPRQLYRWQRAPTHCLLVCWRCWVRYVLKGLPR